MVDLTLEDFRLILQRLLNIRVRIAVYNKTTNEYMDDLDFSIVSGSSSIDATSDVRRTFSLTLSPLKNERLGIFEDGLIWINRIVKLKIGIQDLRTEQYTWYDQGVYLLTDTSSTYDATTNQLTLNCSDLISLLDGSVNGQLYGADTIKFQRYDENENGEPIKYYYIRDAIINVLSQLAEITDYQISEIGTPAAMPEYNTNYEDYRKNNIIQVTDENNKVTYYNDWGLIPYDQEFSPGSSIWNVLTTFRDLYSENFWEMFFDEYGTFICQMIPLRTDDDCVFNNDFIQSILISEDTTLELNTVRNIVEVWGESIDANYFTDECTLNNDTYITTVSTYEDESGTIVTTYENYTTGDLIAIKLPKAHSGESYLNVNDKGKIPIYSEATETFYDLSNIEENEIYVFKIKKRYTDSTNVWRAYYQGRYSVHVLEVLTDGTIESDGKYSLEYFKNKYNCEHINMNVIENSPFTVQKIGEIVDVKNDGNYANASSVTNALYWADSALYECARLTDSITISTKICPYADVNIKVNYRRSDRNYSEEYIVKSISHDWSAGTTSWNLVKFYSAYGSTGITKGVNHEGLKSNTHKYLHNFKNLEISYIN